MLLSFSLFYREVQMPRMIVTLIEPSIKFFSPGHYRIVASASHHEYFDGCASHRFYGTIAYNRKE
jgi:hypothetical protein